MTKQEIKAKASEALTHAAKAYNLLRVIGWNDTLTDESGKNVEREYNHIYNAIDYLNEAVEELRGIEIWEE